MVEYTVALDLGVTVTTPGRLTNGATGAVSVRVTNHGALDASPASLTVTLPSHVELVTLPPECVRATGNLQCTTSVIRAGESVSMALTLRATAPGMASMNVTVVGHESDPVASNNSASGALTGPREADVDVIEPAAADSNLGRTSSRTLEFTVVNRGPEAAENTLVRFALASGFTIEEALASTGTCVVAGQQVSCSFLSLGVDMPVPVRLRVLANVAGQQHVDFDASSDAFDGNTNQQGRATFNVLPMSDVSVEVSSSSASLTTGSAYSYNATVRNAGPDAARPVVNFSMTGAALSQVSSGGGVCVLVAPSQASCQLSDIPSGGSATISLNASAAAAGTATLASEVAVPGSLDPLRANGSATTSTAVTAPPGAGAGAGGAKSGGGGRFDWWLLAALGLLAPLRRPRATSWSRG
jgi:hypothetical protein